MDRIQSWLSLLNRQKFELEDPLYPWVETSRSSNFAADWGRLAARYASEAKSRAAYNQEHFHPFGDFRSGGFSGWYSEGLGLLGGASPAGEFAVAERVRRLSRASIRLAFTPMHCPSA